MNANFSFKTKLLLLSSITSFICLLIAFIGYYGLQQVEKSSEHITSNVVPNLELVNSMAYHYKEVRIEVRTLGLAGITKEEGEKAVLKAEEAIKNYEEVAQVYEKLELNAEEKVLATTLSANWKSFKEIGGRAISAYKSGKPEDAEELKKIFFVDCPKAAADYSQTLSKLLKFHDVVLKKYTDEAHAIQEKIDFQLILFSVGGVLLGFISNFIFATRLSKTMSVIVNKLESTAGELSGASVQIASSSDELSRSATEQAAAIEETSASIEEINSMLSSSTENAKQSAKASEDSLASAEKGKKVVGQMIKAFDDINTSNNSIINQIDSSNKEIEEIVQLIKEVGDKTKVINDIVFQTKLLSFNASVEAARAGEHGKGFAVVAEEVGNLAQMSGNAAVEISKMLDGSIHKVENIIKNTKDKIGSLVAEGKTSLEAGTQIANDCGVVLDEIVSSVATVTNGIAEITSASVEQSQGIQEINKAIGQLDQVTNKNTASSLDSARSAENLSKQATTLKSLVSELVMTMEGNTSGQKKSASVLVDVKKNINTVTVKHEPVKTVAAKAVEPAKAKTASAPVIALSKKKVEEIKVAKETMAPKEENVPVKEIIQHMPRSYTDVPLADDKRFKDV